MQTTTMQPLQYLGKAKFLNNSVMRSALFLQSYKMGLEAMKGSDNVAADLSN